MAQITLRPRRENTLIRKEQLGVMPKIDVLDEAIIDSPPMVVYKAILNEYAGVTNWWMPYCESKLRGDVPIGHEGAIYDATIYPTSRMNIKFSAKACMIL